MMAVLYVTIGLAFVPLTVDHAYVLMLLYRCACEPYPMPAHLLVFFRQAMHSPSFGECLKNTQTWKCHLRGMFTRLLYTRYFFVCLQTRDPLMSVYWRWEETLVIVLSFVRMMHSCSFVIVWA